ncbi:hypothetical protein E4U53_004642 [Claviceps sorghi]|nr:hypothetical protein E4U53_004642 [Claviceps sorghi]
MASVPTPREMQSTSSRATQALQAEAQDNSGPKKKRFNGVLQDGQWWCNCDPREKAILREVMKEGPNKGRFFWTCTCQPYCNFFLWREDAVKRERRLAEGLRHTKKGGKNEHDDETEQKHAHKPKGPTFTQKPLESFGIQTSPARRLSALGAGDTDDDGGSDSTTTSFVSADIMREHASASGTSPASPTTPSSKRKRTSQENWDNDDCFSDLNSDEERQLAELADDNTKKVASKKAVDDVFATPATGRNAANIVAGLPTPPVSRTLFPSSDGKRPKTVSFEDLSPSSTMTTPSKKPPPSTLPRPGASANTNASISAATPSDPLCDSIHDLANQVMGYIKGQNVNPRVVRDVQKCLITAEQRIKSVAAKRDGALHSLQERDERIKRLREENHALRTQVKHDQKTLTNIKQGLRKMYDEI